MTIPSVKMSARLSDRARRLFPAAGLLLVAVLAYWPAIRHGGFIWDDGYNITGNALLLSPAGLRDIWTQVGPGEGGTLQYYPLTYTSFWLEYRLWGLRPAGYHLTNVLLHGLNAVLLWIILLRLRVPGALLAAAVFALHPVHVESVAWVTERKNVLSGLFYFLSLLSFIRFFSLDERSEGKPSSRLAGGRFAYYLGLALFVCALASKTATVTLPAALLLLIWWRTGRIGWRNVLLTAPLFLLAVGAGLVTTYVEKYQGGAIGEEWTLSAVEHVLLAGRIVWFYAGKLLWPQPLMLIYPRWEINQAAWAQYLFPFGAAAVLAALFSLRRSIGRGPLAAVSFFIVTLAPLLGFVDVQYMRLSYVADHFQYLAGLGPMVLSSAAAVLAWRKFVRWNGTASRVPAAALLLTLGVLTWRQSGIYISETLAWEDAVRKNPSAWLARGNLAASLSAEGRTEQALPHLRAALSLRPGLYDNEADVADSLSALGRTEEALAHYRKALRLRPDNPLAHNNLGLALAAIGRPEEAVAHYRESLRLGAENHKAHNNLGLALSALGRTGEAVAQYREALRIVPDFPEAHNNLGVILARLGRSGEAIAHYREALRLKPDYPEAHNNWAAALAGLGRPEEAAAHYREALRLRPGYPEAHNNLGVTLARLSKNEEAAEHFMKALRLRPDYTQARGNLAAILSRPGGEK